MKEWLYHGLTGNDGAEGQVGLTRGTIAAALTELVYLTVRWLPVSVDDKLDIGAHTTALVVLVSFLLYAYLDKWLKRLGKK